EQRESTLDQRRPHVSFQHALRLNDRVHLGVEYPIGSAAIRLRAVHGKVCVLEQALGVYVAGMPDRDANACADRHFMAVDGVRMAGSLDDLLRQQYRIRRLRARHLQYRKFVTAQSRDTIGRWQQVSKLDCDGFQEQVTDRVPERVIDSLESV